MVRNRNRIQHRTHLGEHFNASSRSRDHDRVEDRSPTALRCDHCGAAMPAQDDLLAAVLGGLSATGRYRLQCEACARGSIVSRVRRAARRLLGVQ